MINARKAFYHFLKCWEMSESGEWRIKKSEWPRLLEIREQAEILQFTKTDNNFKPRKELTPDIERAINARPIWRPTDD
jgi:hypothetical protein